MQIETFWRMGTQTLFFLGPQYVKVSIGTKVQAKRFEENKIRSVKQRDCYRSSEQVPGVRRPKEVHVEQQVGAEELPLVVDKPEELQLHAEGDHQEHSIKSTRVSMFIY